MVNIEDFYSKLVEINKKSHKDINMYYTGYIMITKIDNYENIHSVNPLYLIINSAIGYFKKKIGEKYLILDLKKGMKKFFLELYQKLKRF